MHMGPRQRAHVPDMYPLREQILNYFGAGNCSGTCGLFQTQMFCWLGAQFALDWCRLPCAFCINFYNVLLAWCAICAVLVQAPMWISYEVLQCFVGSVRSLRCTDTGSHVHSVSVFTTFWWRVARAAQDPWAVHLPS